jgi:hypothetical protein
VFIVTKLDNAEQSISSKQGGDRSLQFKAFGTWIQNNALAIDKSAYHKEWNVAHTVVPLGGIFDAIDLHNMVGVGISAKNFGKTFLLVKVWKVTSLALLTSLKPFWEFSRRFEGATGCPALSLLLRFPRLRAQN